MGYVDDIPFSSERYRNTDYIEYKVEFGMFHSGSDSVYDWWVGGDVHYIYISGCKRTGCTGSLAFAPVVYICNHNYGGGN